MCSETSSKQAKTIPTLTPLLFAEPESLLKIPNQGRIGGLQLAEPMPEGGEGLILLPVSPSIPSIQLGTGQAPLTLLGSLKEQLRIQLFVLCVLWGSRT